MSENYRFYAEKIKEHRAAAATASPELTDQLADLFLAVRRCEAMWALEERIERGFGHGSDTKLKLGSDE